MNESIIGITDCGKFGNYEKWITSQPGTKVIRLGYRFDNFDEIKNCDGILLTGGQDVHPRFYKRPEYLENCHEVDQKRDVFELSVLDYAQQEQLPVLGICRGLQLANVYFGGTLIPDIPSSGKPDHSKFSDGSDRYHPIQVKENSFLEKIVGKKNGEINSAHHQSADRIGQGLIGNATSEDGIVEGLERMEAQGKPFLLLTQWHPERMNEQQSEFSKNIKESFLEAVRKS